MYLKSKINLFLPEALADTVSGLITVQGENISETHPVFEKSKIASAQILNYPKLIYYFFKYFSDGVSIKGILSVLYPFSIRSITLPWALIDRQNATSRRKLPFTYLYGTALSSWQIVTTESSKPTSFNELKWLSPFILDYEKVLDTPPHGLLKWKLFEYGIRGKALLWIDSLLWCRQQRVVINGAKSK